MKCPHIKNCKQLIDKEHFGLCLGEIEDWDFGDCYKYHDNGPESNKQNPLKMAKQWNEGD